MHPAKRRSVLFGGVVDHEIRKGEVIVSEFFSDSYAMSLENGRWFPVTLYADKSDKTGTAPSAGGGLAEAERVARDNMLGAADIQEMLGVPLLGVRRRAWPCACGLAR